ncbi:DUF6389 family protein [Microbacterium marinilacus]|uniref:Immunity protein Imm1 n=1 Tax=Microbacterium marinilacus TaxID=415209 RepID=A0ABP7B3H3_9MICO|nr:DUF6389 family protein [Microbacterium marinilacus]MBY0687879.1 DUF6389 family protein [Microbacterium marinilacus]
MDTHDYGAAVRRILAAGSEKTAERLARFDETARGAGEGVDGIVVDVFLDQDGEGPFDVWARFEGREAFALDRRFDDDRHLFEVVWTETGWEPDVPSRPHGWSHEDLEDAVVEAVTAWIEPLIPTGSPDGFWRIGAAGFD